MKRALIICFLLIANSVTAQPYPSKSIRFIVPFAPGGTNDIVARMVGVKLTEAWGQPVVIDNRGGAGGVIGADLAAKSVPDGYTLLMANVNFATNPGLVRNLPYDTEKDFAAVSLLATSPSVLVVHPSIPVRSVKEMIAFAKAKPGQLSSITSRAASRQASRPYCRRLRISKAEGCAHWPFPRPNARPPCPICRRSPRPACRDTNSPAGGVSSFPRARRTP